MTSVYTELTKEAAKRGGPAALRAFYRNLGRTQGAVVGAAAASVGALIYNKVNARRTSSSATPVPEQEGKSSPDGSAQRAVPDTLATVAGDGAADSTHVLPDPSILNQ